MKTRGLLIGAALLGVLAGFILSAIDMFGSLILFLITYRLCADGEAERRLRYGALIAPYWIFILTLYGTDLIRLQNYEPAFVSVAIFLMVFGAILGIVSYGLKKIFRAYALKQPQSLEG